METKPLAALAPGETGVLRRILLPRRARERLEELGFLPGTSIACRFRAPGGSPAAYALGGAVFALRTDDAAHIELEGPP